jgi:uncharacterized protein
MKIDVSDLLKSLGAELKVRDSEKLSLKEDNVILSSPVSVDLKLVNTGMTVLVTGSLRTTVRQSCCRCLKEFDQPLEVEIEEEYAKKQPFDGKSEKDDFEEVELDEKDFVFEIDEKNIIDIDEAIRQDIILALPIKPLCNKACKVPQIEKRASKKVDPRLEKLSELKIGGK